jgi:hypothetical protein
MRLEFQSYTIWLPELIKTRLLGIWCSDLSFLFLRGSETLLCNAFSVWVGLVFILVLIGFLLETFGASVELFI